MLLFFSYQVPVFLGPSSSNWKVHNVIKRWSSYFFTTSEKDNLYLWPLKYRSVQCSEVFCISVVFLSFAFYLLPFVFVFYFLPLSFFFLSLLSFAFYLLPFVLRLSPFHLVFCLLPFSYPLSLSSVFPLCLLPLSSKRNVTRASHTLMKVHCCRTRVSP